MLEGIESPNEEATESTIISPTGSEKRSHLTAEQLSARRAHGAGRKAGERGIKRPEELTLKERGYSETNIQAYLKAYDDGFAFFNLKRKIAADATLTPAQAKNEQTRLARMMTRAKTVLSDEAVPVRKKQHLAVVNDGHAPVNIPLISHTKMLLTAFQVSKDQNEHKRSHSFNKLNVTKGQRLLHRV